LADISAVKEAIGLRRSGLFLGLFKSKYPDPVDEAEVVLVKVELEEEEIEPKEELNARANGPLCRGFGRCCCCWFCCEISHRGEWSSMGDITNGICLPFSWARGEASMLDEGGKSKARKGEVVALWEKRGEENR
jgi:hypothetical protein